MVEIEEREPKLFNRASCIQASIAGLKPDIISSMAMGSSLNGFEEKYLGSEVKEELPAGVGVRFRIPFYRITTVEPAIEEFGLELSNMASTLGNSDLISMSSSRNPKLQELGTAIKDKALGYGLVYEQDIADVKNRLANPDGLYLDSSDYNNIHTRGWEIFDSQKGDGYIMVFKPQEEGENLACIDLGDLYARDPEFVKESIRKFHEVNLKSKLANTIIYNLAIHETGLDEIVPDILIELTKAEDMEAEQLQLVRFTGMANLVNMGIMGESNFIDKYLGSIRSARGKIPDGRQVYIDSCLAHISTCPAETEDKRSNMADLQGAYQWLTSGLRSSIGYPKEAQGENWATDQRILQHPDYYIDGWIDHLELRETEGLSGNEKFAGFLDKLTVSATQEETLQLLSQELPDLYESLVQFKQFLGNDGSQSKFESLINEVNRVLGIRGDKATLREDVYSLLEKQLFFRVPYSLSFQTNPWFYRSGIYPNNQRNQPDVHFKNQLFKDAVAVLAVLPNQSLIEQLRDKYKQAIEDNMSQLAEFKHTRAQMSVLLDRAGMPRDTVDKLAELFRDKNRNDDGLNYFIGFKVMFNILYLSSLGLINPKSQVLRTFVKGVYPSITEQAWKLLD